MLKEGKTTFVEERDRKFIIPESVQMLRHRMYERLYDKIGKTGKLEFERSKSKEEVLGKIQGLINLGRAQGHSLEPTDRMIKYLEEEFDTQCMVEFLNRVRRTYLWDTSRHDPRYIEQDLPLADDQDVALVTSRVSEWGRIEEEIAAEKAQESGPIK